MIIKRWATTFAFTLIGCMLGVILGAYLPETLKDSVMVQILSVLTLGGLLGIAGYQVAKKWFPARKKERLRPEVSRRQWAWIRPKGFGNKPGYPINRSRITIGRSVKSTITINHESISRDHAIITRIAEGYMLRDNDSSNGTFVNGQRISERILQDGDEVCFGEKAFYFEVPDRVESQPENSFELEQAPTSLHLEEQLNNISSNPNASPLLHDQNEAQVSAQETGTYRYNPTEEE